MVPMPESASPFTEDQLKDKEKELLDLMKRTIAEFRTAWIKNSKTPGWYSGYYIGPQFKDYIKFKKGKIHIKLLSDQEGMAIVWGKLRYGAPRNLKITFKLESQEMLLKFDSFVKYPFETNFLIKDIFYRMDIKTESDYNYLLSGFKNLLVSYI